MMYNICFTYDGNDRTTFGVVNDIDEADGIINKMNSNCIDGKWYHIEVDLKPVNHSRLKEIYNQQTRDKKLYDEACEEIIDKFEAEREGWNSPIS